MAPFEAFDGLLTAAERGTIGGLTSPAKIQGFLDEIAYSTDEFLPLPAEGAARAHRPLLRRGHVCRRRRCAASATRR
ncbi:MAG: hypothetical protein MZV70_54720 [Desulfobacterales bacterium]|nr:hypothetical protein [Desulfobacterales bacterium]